jgi:hypothetical protein
MNKRGGVPAATTKELVAGMKKRDKGVSMAHQMIQDSILNK